LNLCGRAYYDPVLFLELYATAIAEIPVIRIEGATDNEIGVNANAYSVKLKLEGDMLQVLELTPIW
jgi:hypothetical protein